MANRLENEKVNEVTMSTKELSDFLPEHPVPGTIRNWVSSKKIPYHKTGDKKSNTLYFKKSEIIKWLENGRVI